MDQLIAYGPLLLRGAGVTLALAVVSLVIATAMGVLGAWAKLSGGAVGRSAAGLYTTLVRGVPELVLMLLVFYGGQQLLNDFGASMGWDYIEVNPFVSGALTIGFIFGAYMTEAFRGAYQTVPVGQGEAARALGLTPLATFLKVTGPQAMRNALPAYGNNWQVLLKATAIVSVIGLEDVVNIADKAGKSNREPFLFFLVVIVIYLIFTAVSGVGLKWLERHYGRGFGGPGEDAGGAKKRGALAAAMPGR